MTRAGPATRRGPRKESEKGAQKADPDLVRSLNAWPTSPAHIRAAVLALVGMVPHP
jgi:hypothetical protein